MPVSSDISFDALSLFSDSSLVFSYGIYLSKYDSNGISLWENPINIVEGGFEDCLVKAVIPNSLNGGVIVIYESASFMGVGLNMISISSDGQILSQSSLCDDCENPQFESYAMGDNEVVVTYKTTSNSLGAAVNAQVLSYNGEILGGANGVIVSDEVSNVLIASNTSPLKIRPIMVPNI